MSARRRPASLQEVMREIRARQRAGRRGAPETAERASEAEAVTPQEEAALVQEVEARMGLSSAGALAELQALNQGIRDINDTMGEFLKLERLKIPVGQSLKLTFSGASAITAQPTTINRRFICPNGAMFDPPYTKVDIFNDGPNECYFEVNGQYKYLVNVPYADALAGAVNPNDMYVEDLVIPQLTSLTLYTDPGNTTAMRCFFKR
jgi:hypothetical protein